MTDTSAAAASGDRLAKIIARSGLCSRREAETWIQAGRVAVNGNVVRTPAFNVTERDKVLVDGAPLPEKRGTRVWLYHKPSGLVVTEKDPEGRPTIFEALEEHGLPRVLTVGRLDINTEGLLLLTNDGGLKRVLELPSTGWMRRYRVRAFGEVTQEMLDRLKHGMEVDGVQYGSIEATLERQQGDNNWLVVGLREGKNREIKNVLGALGLQVNRLIRISYGPFQLGDLAIGAVETVSARVLRDQLGKKLAEEAQADFDSEMPGRDTGAPQRGGRSTGRPGGGQRDSRDARSGGGGGRPDKGGFGGDRKGGFGGNRSGGGGGRFRDDAARGQREDRGPKRMIHFDQTYDEGRASEAFADRDRERGPRRDDRGGQGGERRFGNREGGERRFGNREGGERRFGDREGGGNKRFGDRPQGGRPASGQREERGGSDRPQRSFGGGDRPQRSTSGGDRPQRSFGGDRPQRDGDRPFRSRDEGFGGGDRPRSPRPVRSGGDDRPKRNFSGPRPERGSDDRPKRSFGASRPDRSSDDRPARNFSGPRPERGGDDRPKRPFSPRPPRDGGDRPARNFGARPERDGGERSQRPSGDRPQRNFAPRGDRPERSFGDSPRPTDKPRFGKRPDGGQGRPAGNRPTGGRPSGGNRPFGGGGNRPAGGGNRPRSAGGPGGPKRGPRPQR